jgi:hypothetical protein
METVWLLAKAIITASMPRARNTVIWSRLQSSIRVADLKNAVSVPSVLLTDATMITKKDQMLAREMAMQRKSHCSCCQRNWPDP